MSILPVYNLCLFSTNILIFLYWFIEALSVLWTLILTYERRIFLWNKTKDITICFGLSFVYSSLWLLPFSLAIKAFCKLLKKYLWTVDSPNHCTYHKVLPLFSYLSMDDNCLGLWLFINIHFISKLLVISLHDFWNLMLCTTLC